MKIMILTFQGYKDYMCVKHLRFLAQRMCSVMLELFGALSYGYFKLGSVLYNSCLYGGKNFTFKQLENHI